MAFEESLSGAMIKALWYVAIEVFEPQAFCLAARNAEREESGCLRLAGHVSDAARGSKAWRVWGRLDDWMTGRPQASHNSEVPSTYFLYPVNQNFNLALSHSPLFQGHPNPIYTNDLPCPSWSQCIPSSGGKSALTS